MLPNPMAAKSIQAQFPRDMVVIAHAFDSRFSLVQALTPIHLIDSTENCHQFSFGSLTALDRCDEPTSASRHIAELPWM